MWLWEFVHNNTPFHVYELLAIILAVIMAVIAGIHFAGKGKRKEK